MALFMVLKERIPSLVEPLVSFGDLTTAFRDALANQHLSQSHWVGPTPRVTRRGGLTERFVVRVAWPLDSLITDASVAAGVTPEGHAREIAHALDRNIAALGSGWAGEWSDAVVTPYSETLNGPISWWDGTASRTLTMDRALVVSPERAENPVGPDNTDTRPGGSPTQNAANDQIGGLASAVKFVAISVMVLGGAYVVGQMMPALNLWSAQRASKRLGEAEVKRTSETPRNNPSHRRSRR